MKQPNVLDIDSQPTWMQITRTPHATTIVGASSRKGSPPMNALRLSPLQHVASFAGAVLIAATLLVGAEAQAQPRSGSFYSATLTVPADAARAVAGGVVWNCAGTDCSAPRGTSRPAVMCARLVREVGQVSSFVANGEALDAAGLERCNAAA